MEQLNIATDDFIEKMAALEVLLFANGEALSSKKIATILEVKTKVVHELVASLNNKYNETSSGLTIYKDDDDYRLTTKRSYAKYLDLLFENTRNKGLSNAALEVLAIIAVSQPITRAEIDTMRGVSSGSLVQMLTARELIYCSGTLEKIGKPKAYSTTKKFLEVFELSSLDELPKINNVVST